LDIEEKTGLTSGGCVGIQETVADDQADDFVGAAVIGFGARSVGDQAPGAFGGVGVEQLIVALAAQAKQAGGLGRGVRFALAQREHRQTAADFIVGADVEGAGGARESSLVVIKSEVHREARIRGRRRYVKLFMTLHAE